MMLFGAAARTEQGEKREAEYVCRNKRCPRFDKRLKEKAAAESDAATK